MQYRNTLDFKLIQKGGVQVDVKAPNEATGFGYTKYLGKALVVSYSGTNHIMLVKPDNSVISVPSPHGSGFIEYMKVYGYSSRLHFLKYIIIQVSLNR